MLGRVYVVEFEGQTVATASGDYDLFYIAPADDKPVKLLACYLAVTSELGDAAEEQLRVRIIRGYTAASTGGNAITASTVGRTLATSPDPAFTARTLDTAVATTGTAFVLHSDAFNVRSGWVYLPTPETTHLITQASTSVVVRLMAAVADDVTMSGSLYIEELG
jgi:hypothetical protein